MSTSTDDTRVQVFTQLGGCQVALIFPTKDQAVSVVAYLSTCEAHKGCHHFAVFAEGLGVYMSENAYECYTGQKWRGTDDLSTE